MAAPETSQHMPRSPDQIPENVDFAAQELFSTRHEELRVDAN